MKRALIFAAALGCAAAAQTPASRPPDPLERMAQSYLWPSSDAEFRSAEMALNADRALTAMSRERFIPAPGAGRAGASAL